MILRARAFHNNSHFHVIRSIRIIHIIPIIRIIFIIRIIRSIRIIHIIRRTRIIVVSGMGRLPCSSQCIYDRASPYHVSPPVVGFVASWRLVLALFEWASGRCPASSCMALSSLGPPGFQASHANFRGLLEFRRGGFHWRSHNKAHCGGPLYARYDKFPNCGGISFEGRVSDSRKAPVSGPCGKRGHGAEDWRFTALQTEASIGGRTIRPTVGVHVTLARIPAAR